MSRLEFKIFGLLAAVLSGVVVVALWVAGQDGLGAGRFALLLLAALAVAHGLARLLGRMAREPLDQIADIARRIVQGDGDARVLWSHHDERDACGSAVNRLADHLLGELGQTRANVQQLEAVMAEMIEGVLVLDSRERIVLVNTAFRELFDVWGEVADRPVLEVVRLPAITTLLGRARESASPVFDDVELRGHVARTVRGRAARFPSAGPRAGTLAVFHDVTEIRRVDRVRRDFVANASHELRTPLTSIQGYAESLASGPMTKEEVEVHVAAIQRNARRMRDLIDDLMDLSRIESEGGAPDPSRVDVVKLLQTLIADAGPRLAHAKLEARIVGAASAVAWADRKALEQVIENLLTNAIRYSDGGGTITLEVEPGDEAITISIADTGIGIPEEALDRIFERFYRVDASRSRAIGSTGLGLAIVRHLVQAMGGTIRVESRLGVGSRFSFTVPRDREDPVGR